MSKPITKLKHYRELKFLSQVELSEISEVCQATISNAEAGGKISLGSIKKLAAALGVKPEKLI